MDEDNGTQFSDTEIGAATVLVSGLTNLVLIKAEYEGQKINLVAALITDDGTPEGAGFIQPMAIMVDPNIGPKLAVDGHFVREAPDGSAPIDWLIEAEAHDDKLPSLRCVDLTPANPVSANVLFDRINASVQHAAEATGGFVVHITDEGWCVHLGPIDTEGEVDEGCKDGTFLGAVRHAVVHHAPDTGDALLGPDDPRATAHLN